MYGSITATEAKRDLSPYSVCVFVVESHTQFVDESLAGCSVDESV